MSKATQTTKKEDPPIGLIQRLALPYYLPCMQYIVVWIIYLYTNEPAYTSAYVLLFPFLGKFLPKDSFPVFHSRQQNNNIFQVFPLVAHVLLTWITIAKVFIDYPLGQYTTEQCVQAFLTLLYLLPASIDAAHQLIHRPQMGFKVLGFLNMAVFQFSVYPYQHIYLHHKQVGTSKDPITSPKNQTFYMYFIRAFISGHKFVFQNNKKVFCLSMLANWTYVGILFFFAMREYNDWQLAGWKVLYFMGLGVSGFAFLEVVEYIEHYGLVYRDEKDDRKVEEICSWNTDENIINNWLIFRFQRHSDHHMNAYKVFTTLELTQKMPRFPFDFLTGSIIGLIPSLWFYVMNPYVDEVLEGKQISKRHRQIVYCLKEGIAWTLMIRLVLGTYATYQLRASLAYI